MTTDVLTETVLDEAEAVMRAEWVRLQTTTPCASAQSAQRRRRPAPPPAARRGRIEQR